MKTLPLLAGTLLLMASCGNALSKREKAMVGKYYISAVSDTRPLLELNADRGSVIRAIRPGDLSFYVAGKWHVDGDSLIIENDVSSITIEEGDAALVGRVAERVAYPIVNFDESTLRIERQGIMYDYHRRQD
jgi:hypothetical protein